MKIVSILFLTFFSLASSAQSDKDVITRVQQEAQTMSDAFHKGDYDRFMDSTHPRVIESIGGREKMKTFLKAGLGSEISFIKTDISEAKKLIKKGENWQCAMRQSQVIEVEGKKYKIQGWLIGISYDAGSEWRFISVSNQTLQTLQQVFPELSNKLRVKPQKEPRRIIEDF
jgi:hypothetical protein